MKTKKLQNFFEENGFKVFLTKENNVVCGEIEKWTGGGVDMIIWLNPFTIKEFLSYVDDFNVDEIIDLHRQDQKYKNCFTITQSVNDFTKFYNHLKEIAFKLENK